MKWILMLTLGLLLWASSPAEAAAGNLRLPVKVTLGVEESEEPQELVPTIQLLLLFAALSLIPAMLLTMTSFTRVVIVLSFVRHAMSLQQLPPNQVLIGLALFLSVFIMAPVWQDVHTSALQPYLAKELGQREALTKATAAVRGFMFKHTRPKDLLAFMKMARQSKPRTPDNVPTHVLIPAFITSELKTAFQMGFVIFLPFLIIDLVVSSVLTSMGMFMMPPVVISVPFKILLFVLVDGWHLIIRSLAGSFG